MTTKVETSLLLCHVYRSYWRYELYASHGDIIDMLSAIDTLVFSHFWMWHWSLRSHLHILVDSFIVTSSWTVPNPWAFRDQVDKFRRTYCSLTNRTSSEQNTKNPMPCLFLRTMKQGCSRLGQQENSKKRER